MAVQHSAQRKREQMLQNPMTCCYNYPNMDFGASAGVTTHQIGGPAGMKGVLQEIGVTLTEAVLDDTLLASVAVGAIGDLDAYGDLKIPDGSLINTVVNSADDTNAILAPDIPADTCVQVTLTEGTDGTGVTGQGQPYVIIHWY